MGICPDKIKTYAKLMNELMISGSMRTNVFKLNGSIIAAFDNEHNSHIVLSFDNQVYIYLREEAAISI